jgi:predicted NACHT family NTPase
MNPPTVTTVGTVSTSTPVPLDDVQKMILSAEVKKYIIRKAKLDTNIKKAYSLAIVQCTEALQSRLKQDSQWPKISEEFDVLLLFDIIKAISFKYEDRKFLPLALHETKMLFYSFRQNNLSYNSPRPMSKLPPRGFIRSCCGCHAYEGECC